MATKKFEVKIEVDSSGNVDVDATTANARGAIQQYADLTSADVEKIESAIAGVFESNPTMSLNVPALQTLVMQKVWSGDPASYTSLQKRVSEVLHNSATVIIQKGQGKGARLRNSEELEYYRANGRDRTAEELKALADEAKKAAARK